MIVLILLLASCRTTKEVVTDLPDIPFPTFPLDMDKAKAYYTEPDKSKVLIVWDDKTEAEISTWLFFDLVEYDIKVQAAYKKYKHLQDSVNASYLKQKERD